MRSESRDQCAFDNCGVNQFNKVLKFCYPEIDQFGANEGIGSLPVLCLELLEPVRETFNEARSCHEVLVVVVLELCHQFQPGKFIAGAVLIPCHYLTQYSQIGRV